MYRNEKEILCSIFQEGLASNKIPLSMPVPKIGNSEKEPG
jgi:hypothetical protein